MDQSSVIMESMASMLKQPSERQYRKVFDLLCQSSIFEPESHAVEAMENMLQNGGFKQLIDLYKKTMPNCVLDPHANLMYAFALKEMGKADTAELFLAASIAICEGIRSTGDGSRKKPYLVTHGTCATGYVQFSLEKEIQTQKYSTDRSRFLLTIYCTDGTEHCFDVTASRGKLPQSATVSDDTAPAPPMQKAHALSPSGQPIYTYEDVKPVEHGFSTGDKQLLDAVTAHVEKYAGKVDMVFHELLSPTIHCDILMVNPSAGRNYSLLITCGMSELAMKTPPGAEELRYAELVVALPPDWPLTQESFKDEKNYWPIRWMKQLARFPHELQTWLSYFHTIPNGNPPARFEPRTKLTTWMLMPPILLDPQFASLKVTENRTIHFLAMMPIYTEEAELKLTKGADALADLLDRHEVSLVLDLKRRNLCAPAQSKRAQPAEEESDNSTIQESNADKASDTAETGLVVGCALGFVVFIAACFVVGGKAFADRFGFIGQLTAMALVLVTCVAGPVLFWKVMKWKASRKRND